MPVSVTGKLNKPASEFAAGDSVGFGIRVGQQYYDRDTKQKEWTNYECAIFAKAQAQIDFYRYALVEGAIVAVSGKEQKIKSFDGRDGQVLTIEIQNASLDNVFSLDAGKSSPTPQQGGFAQPAQQQPKQLGGDGSGGFATPPATKKLTWEDYKPTSSTNGATLEQVKVKYNGDLQAAIANGHLEAKTVSNPNFNDFDDDLPF